MLFVRLLLRVCASILNMAIIPKRLVLYSCDVPQIKKSALQSQLDCFVFKSIVVVHRGEITKKCHCPNTYGRDRILPSPTSHTQTHTCCSKSTA